MSIPMIWLPCWKLIIYQHRINYPLLIRRPLIQVGDICRVGFERDKIDAWIGLASPKIIEDLETCPR